ncbi:tRNA/rRNA methyltransferase [Advenella incenata]|jgi:tRNA/rRNA methyltransferase|uniref:tRNA/rRNA methyltransferase n=1 Tax=Advenella incenata TaxID=267800 RepID=A0A4Q7VBX5_9BURK|nr:RNA methyltransferase [Advenella incenata]RZT92823.1 tRNA/rRNA methyltransferase [Advenella incenata]
MSPLHTRVRFIMVSPTHPGNVGSAARAIKNMGFGDLVLVNPKDSGILAHEEALALASGAADILETAQIAPDLDTALTGITLAFALTARTRDMGPPSLDIRQTAQLSRTHLNNHTDTRIAIVLGTERTGLDNDDISRCHRICHIPANPSYSSLNVSQALLLAAWELNYAMQAPPTARHISTTAPAAASQSLSTVTQELTDRPDRLLSTPAQGYTDIADRDYAPAEKVEAFINHWESALIGIDFLNPNHPKKLMPRMRYMFTRIHMTQEEVDMMRGVCTNILKTVYRP